MNEPHFIYSPVYYFDVNNRVIYGKKKYSKKYFHELSHYKDYSNKFYKTINLFFQGLIQIFSTAFGMCLIYFLITMPVIGVWNRMFMMLGILFSPYCLWTLQEEIRADIMGSIYYKRHIKSQ